MLYLIRYILAVFSPIHFVDGLDNRRISFCTDNSKTMFPENYVVHILFVQNKKTIQFLTEIL